VGKTAVVGGMRAEGFFVNKTLARTLVFYKFGITGFKFAVIPDSPYGVNWWQEWAYFCNQNHKIN
jgi:hypothetical protein